MAISHILFDLDNTLYHPISPMLKRINIQITRYIMDMFDVSFDTAYLLRREAFHTYGTTLRWLQKEHGFEDTEDYLDFIHPKDTHLWIEETEPVGEILSSIPQCLSILTNSTEEHAKRVLNFLGISHVFSAIYDIRFNNLISKPDPQAYTRVLDALPVSRDEVLFIDDNPAFLQPFIDLGGQAALMDHQRKYPDCLYVRFTSLQEAGEYIKNAVLI